MVLVHDDRDMGKFVHSRFHHGAQERSTRVLAGTGTGLHDNRRVRLVRCFHDRAGLLQVVHIESRYAVAVFGGVIQQLTHTD